MSIGPKQGISALQGGEDVKRFAIPIPFLALLAIFLLRAPSRLASGITDPDYYWHLGYGEWILDNGRLPTVDFWSWTFDGHSYRLTQWLGEVSMALANRAGGEFGTQILSAALVSLTIAFSYRAARCFLDNRLAALAVALFCDASLVSLACRPHQFTFLGLAVLTALVADYQTTGRRRALYWIPALMALWVNLHGGYVMGLFYLWMLAALAMVDAYVTHRHEAFRSVAAPLAIAALAGTLATLINPYGTGAWEYAIEIAGLKSSSANIIDEWMPTSIKMDVGLNFFLASCAVFAAMAASKERPRPQALLAALALTAIGWCALRLALVMSVLFVPLLAHALRGTALHELVFDGPARRHDRPIRLIVAAPLAAGAFAITQLLATTDTTATRYLAETYPEQEVAFMKAHRISGRLLNNFETGGYLIRTLGQKVSLDTRLDLYGDRALFGFLLARRGEAGWREFVAQQNADVVVLDNSAALRQLMIEAGLYRMVFEGRRFSVLVRPGDYPHLPTVQPSLSRRDLLNQLKS